MDTMYFFGTREEILHQLHKFMDETSANKFFACYIDTSLFQRLPTRGRRNNVRKRGRTRNLLRFHNEYSIRYKQSSIVAKRMLVDSASIGQNARERQGGTLDTIHDSNGSGKDYILNRSKLETIVYKKAFTKILFVMCAISLDITLMLTIGFSPVGVALSAISHAFKTNQNAEKQVAQCIIGIVKNRGNLPKFSSIKNQFCKNYELKCIFMSNGKCEITKDMFKRVVEKLIDKEVLILENNTK